MKSYKHKYGVTLVEMLIVVAIIALLTTMVIGIAARIDNQSKERALKNTFGLLEGALQEYYEYWGDFPIPNDPNYPTSSSSALYGQLHSTPSSRKILEEISDSLIDEEHSIYDPWKVELDYRYVAGNNFPELISAGPDRDFNTPDDITSR
jgi:prepilin-type N-terminal cleavage/methylation domain-containing protein